ncbi:MAG TPA: N,N-dimethylformamidase beta subunit family domain-containing protein [Verrucomicrobiae bacterium]|nr:N,N-dimethylformamidase beta subunit family domain-containing protein [Verrucomicrobiae bacterium]
MFRPCLRLGFASTCLWLLSTVGLWAADDLGSPSLFIEGYAGQVSYQAGDDVTFHISTSAASYALEIARLGAKRDVVLTTNGLRGASYAIPENACSHGCAWPSSFQVKVPPEWRSGYYQVLLRVSDNGAKFVQRNRRTAEGECFFVLRPPQPGQRARILLELSCNTYNAYNNWGGFSLYGFHARGGNQGNRVSFLRPPTSQFSIWEQPFVAWAEGNGYVLDFCANSDLEFHPELLAPYRLILSVGHDEYWSAPMRDHLEAFIGGGGNVAFFSGNTCCWQVRSEENGAALVAWKQNYHLDPIYRTGDHKLLTTLWSHHLVGRPENQLTGVGFLFGGYHRSHGQFMDGKASYTVHRPDHWVFEKTGLKRGDEFGGKDTIVGYECDGCEFAVQDGLPIPTGRDGTPKDFVILGSCPARWHPDDAFWYEKFDQKRLGASVLGVYTRNGTVFTCGATDWAHGLRGKDPAVEQITRNVLDRLSRL